MASASDIRAGGAFVELYLKGGSLVESGLDKISQKTRAFTTTLTTMSSVANITYGHSATAIRTSLMTAAGLVDKTARTIRTSVRATAQVLTATLDSIPKTIDRVGKALKSFGTKSLFAGLLAGGAGVGVMNAFMEFERQMQRVKALTGASGVLFEAMTEKVRELGRTTQYTSAQAADGMAYLAMAGLKARDAINVLPVVLDLATAAMMDLGQTADIVTDIGLAFGYTGKETQRVADVIAQAATNSNTTVEMMGMSFKYLASFAVAAGQSIEDMAAAVAMLAQVGIKKNTAGTGLREALVNLVTPPKRKKLEEILGVRVADARGQMRPIFEIIEDLKQSLQRFPQVKQLELMSQIFGKRGGNVMLSLVHQTDEARNAMQSLMYTSEGAVSRMAGIMRDSLWGDWKNVVSILEDIQLEMGNALVPAVRGFLKYFTSALQTFDEFIAKNHELVIGVAMSIPVLLGAGTAALALGEALTTIATIIEPAVSALTIGMNTISTAIAGATGLMGVFSTVLMTVASGVQSVAAMMQSTVGMISMLAMAAGGAVTTMTALAGLPMSLVRGISSLAGSVSGLFASITSGAKTAVNTVDTIVQSVSTGFVIVGKVVVAATAAQEAAAKSMNTAIDAIRNGAATTEIVIGTLLLGVEQARAALLMLEAPAKVLSIGLDLAFTAKLAVLRTAVESALAPVNVLRLTFESLETSFILVGGAARLAAAQMKALETGVILLGSPAKALQLTFDGLDTAMQASSTGFILVGGVARTCQVNLLALSTVLNQLDSAFAVTNNLLQASSTGFILVGNTAETASSSIKSASNSLLLTYDAMAETIGTVVSTTAEMTDTMGDVIDVVSDAASASGNMAEAATEVAPALAEVSSAAVEMGSAMSEVTTEAAKTSATIGMTLAGAVVKATLAIAPLVLSIGTLWAMGSFGYAVITGLIKLVADCAVAFWNAAKSIGSAFGSAVIGSLGAIGNAMKTLSNNTIQYFQQNMEGLTAWWASLKFAFGQMVETYQFVVKAMQSGNVKDAMQLIKLEAFRQLKSAETFMRGLLAGLIREFPNIMSALGDIFQSMFSDLGNVFTDLWTSIKQDLRIFMAEMKVFLSEFINDLLHSGLFGMLAGDLGLKSNYKKNFESMQKVKEDVFVERLYKMGISGEEKVELLKKYRKGRQEDVDIQSYETLEKIAVDKADNNIKKVDGSTIQTAEDVIERYEQARYYLDNNKFGHGLDPRQAVNESYVIKTLQGAYDSLVNTKKKKDHPSENYSFYQNAVHGKIELTPAMQAKRKEQQEAEQAKEAQQNPATNMADEILKNDGKVFEWAAKQAGVNLSPEAGSLDEQIKEQRKKIETKAEKEEAKKREGKSQRLIDAEKRKEDVRAELSFAHQAGLSNSIDELTQELKTLEKVIKEEERMRKGIDESGQPTIVGEGYFQGILDSMTKKQKEKNPYDVARMERLDALSKTFHKNGGTFESQAEQEEFDKLRTAYYLSKGGANLKSNNKSLTDYVVDQEGKISQKGAEELVQLENRNFRRQQLQQEIADIQKRKAESEAQLAYRRKNHPLEYVDEKEAAARRLEELDPLLKQAEGMWAEVEQKKIASEEAASEEAASVYNKNPIEENLKKMNESESAYQAEENQFFDFDFSPFRDAAKKAGFDLQGDSINDVFGSMREQINARSRSNDEYTAERQKLEEGIAFRKERMKGLPTSDILYGFIEKELKAKIKELKNLEDSRAVKKTDKNELSARERLTQQIESDNQEMRKRQDELKRLDKGTMDMERRKQMRGLDSPMIDKALTSTGSITTSAYDVIFGNAGASNPMLNEMRTHTELLTEIRDTNNIM